MERAKWIRWAGSVLLPLILVGLPPSGLSQAENVVPGGTPRHQDSAAALRVEVVDGELLLDGWQTPFDSLRSAIAARCAESPPAIYRVMLPASLECHRVEGILAAIGGGHLAVGQAAQYAHAPVLLGLAGTDDLDAVAITIPMPAYRAMAYQAGTVRHVEIAQQGGLLVDGVACEWEQLPNRLFQGPANEGTAPKLRTAWVYFAARGEAPFARLHEALCVARQAEVPCVSLCGSNALIDLEAPAGHRPAKQRVATPTGPKGGPRHIDGFNVLPEPFYRVDPVYPDSAAQLGLGGNVKLLLFVNEFGAVFNTLVLQATGPNCLSDAARAAAAQWRFLPSWPGEREPVKTTITIPFDFIPEVPRVKSKPERTAPSDSAAAAVEVYGWRPPEGAMDNSAGLRNRSGLATLRMEADGALALNGQPVAADSLAAAIAASSILSPPDVFRLELPRELPYSELAALLRAIREGCMSTDSGSRGRIIPLVFVEPSGDRAAAIPLLIPGRQGGQLRQKPETLVTISLLGGGGFQTGGVPQTASELAANLERLVKARRRPVVLLDPGVSLLYADLFAALRLCSDAGVELISLPSENRMIELPGGPSDQPGDLAWIQSTEHWGTPNVGYGRSVSTQDAVEPPVPLHRVAPEMPDSLRAAGLKGAVIVIIFVDWRGSVFDAQVVSSNLPAALDSLALAAARQWRFRPGKTQGRAVSASVSIPFKFPPPPVH